MRCETIHCERLEGCGPACTIAALLAKMSRDPRLEAVPPAEPETPEDRERRRKQEKRARREVQPLQPWERYRAMADAYKIAQDLVEFADRKVRFGLIVIGAINVVVFGAALRTETALIIPPLWRPWVLVALGLYAIVLVRGVGHALSALRPRINPLKTRLSELRGLHFYDDVLSRELPEYERSWYGLSMRELCALMAEQTYALAHINRGKFGALEQMYSAIRTMLAMGAGLLVAAVALVFLRAEQISTPPPASTAAAVVGETETDSREYKMMLAPERFGEPRTAIAAFWRLVDAQRWPGAQVDLALLERRLAPGPSRRRLLQFFDAATRPGDTCRPADPSAYLFECHGLVVRSRVDVLPHAPGAPFEIDPSRPRPMELTLKSRGPSPLVATAERRLSARADAAGAPLEVRAKLEKDMTVGRTTWGQSVSVRFTADEARPLFTGKAPLGPGVAVPADLAELQALYTVPRLAGVANRPLAPVAGQLAYEEAWTAEGALILPRGQRATITTSLWYDPAGSLKVVETSWRLLQTPSEPRLAADVVGASEQLLDAMVAAGARDGWFDAEAPLKKAHALGGSGD